MRTDEIRARLDAATPGPWVNPYSPESIDSNAITDAKGNTVVGAGWLDGPQLMVTQPDAALIANAPTDIANLLGENDRKDAENAVLRKALELACEDAASGGSWHPETVTAESLMGYYLREASTEGGRP